MGFEEECEEAKNEFEKARERIRSSEAYKKYSEVAYGRNRTLNVKRLKSIPLIGVRRVNAPLNREGIESLTKFFFIGNPEDEIKRVSMGGAGGLNYVSNLIALNIEGKKPEFYGDVFMGFRKMFGRSKREDLPTHFALTSIPTSDWTSCYIPSFTNTREKSSRQNRGYICILTLLRDTERRVKG